MPGANSNGSQWNGLGGCVWQEKQVFNFDLANIDWDSYITSTHVPGLRKYVLKGRGSKKVEVQNRKLH
eukprot:8049907-Pyramimonas_sp.AAC.1